MVFRYQQNVLNDLTEMNIVWLYFTLFVDTLRWFLYKPVILYIITFSSQLIYNYPEQLFADAGVMAIEHADFDGIERLALVTGMDFVLKK